MSALPKLSTVETNIPTPEELLDRARALIPALKQRAGYGSQERQLDPATIQDLQEAGLFRVLQPKRYGGYEMKPGAFYDIVMALAEGDMSAAWVYGVVGVHAWQIACFDDRTQHEVWGKDPGTLISSTYMPGGKAKRVEGGYRFTGRWGYSSGSEYCQWVILGGLMVDDDGKPTNEGGNFLLPRSDYEIVDTWETPGLRGTGSNDIVVTDIFIPDHHVMSPLAAFQCQLPGQAVNHSVLYKMPFGQVFARAVSTAAIGALQGMVNEVVETAKTRLSVFGTRAFQDPVALLALAEAQNEVDQLKLVLHRNFDTLWSYAERGEAPPIELRSQYRFQASLPAERVSIMAARLFKSVGGAAVYQRTPYGRMLNDISVGRQHAANQFEMFGRAWASVLIGQDNQDFFL